MFYVFYGCFKDNQSVKKFQGYTMKPDHDQNISKSLPEGAKYINTYFTVEGAQDHDFEAWYEIENFGVIDAWRNHEPWDKLLADLFNEIGEVFKWVKIKYLRSKEDVRFRF